MDSALCALCEGLGLIANAFPQMPSFLTIGGLITAAGNAMPLVGTGILVEIFTMVRDILLLLVGVKIVRFVTSELGPL